RRREGSEQLELAATEQGSNLRNRIGLNRVDLREPIEEPPPAADEESEFHGQPTGLRVVSRFIEPDDFHSLSGEIEPRLEWRRSGRGPLPKLKDEKAAGFEVRSDATECLEDVSLRQKISEGSEQTEGRVEPLSESKRSACRPGRTAADSATVRPSSSP